MKWPRLLGPEPELTPDEVLVVCIVLMYAYFFTQLLFPCWGQTHCP